MSSPSDLGDLEATRRLSLEHTNRVVLLRCIADLGNVVGAEATERVLF